MTPEEFKAQMELIDIKFGGDVEAAHGMADQLMCELLKALGYAEGVKVFQDMDRWYA